MAGILVKISLAVSNIKTFSCVLRKLQKCFTALLLPTFWHLLHGCDPLLPFFSCSGLDKVVNLVWGDDLKEVAVNVIFLGWNMGKEGGRELQGAFAGDSLDSKVGHVCPAAHSPSGTYSTAVTTEPRSWMAPRGLSLWRKGRKKTMERLCETRRFCILIVDRTGAYLPL